MENKKTPNFFFEIMSDEELFPELQKKNILLSNVRSECCTRVCTRTRTTATEKQWKKFLEVEAGVVMY